MRLAGSLITAVLLIAVPPAHATVIADSLSEFAGSQGADNWFYGFYNQGVPSGSTHGYTTGGFVEFDTYDPSIAEWNASDAQVGANNNDFLGIDADGGHPTGIGPGGQNSVIWAIRRYRSEVAGMVDVGFDLRKLNVGNDRGGGITGRIFVDGVEVFTRPIGNTDGLGVQMVIPVSVLLGSVIDFAIDPTGEMPLSGNDGIFSARADGSVFRARICTPAGAGPCFPTELSAPPAPWWLLTILFGVMARTRLRARR